MATSLAIEGMTESKGWFAISGRKLVHGTIRTNTGVSLHNQLKRTHRAYMALARVRVNQTDYFYPDVVVAPLRERLLGDAEGTLLDPLAIIEVLSPTTEAYDRGKKFRMCQSSESLREYILIAQDEVKVESFVRQPDNTWTYTKVDRLEDSLALSSVRATLKLSDVYDRIFPLEA